MLIFSHDIKKTIEYALSVALVTLKREVSKMVSKHTVAMFAKEDSEGLERQTITKLCGMHMYLTNKRYEN